MRLTLLILLFTSCAYHQIGDRKRIPANQDKLTCFDVFRALVEQHNLQRQDTLHSWSQKKIRKVNITKYREAIEKSDFREAMEQFKKNHFHYDFHYVETKKLVKWMEWNNNPEVPFLYHGEKIEGVDKTLLEVMDYVGSKKLAVEDPVYSQINKWLRRYGRYWKRIEEQIHKGIEAQEQLKTMNKYNAEKRFNSLDDFTTGEAVKVRLPYLVEGNWTYIEQDFSSYTRLKGFMINLENTQKEIFNYKNQSYRSKLNNRMHEQGILFRYLSMTRNRLINIPSHRQTALQKRLLRRVNKLLNNENIRPRKDFLNEIHRKEQKAEMKSWFLRQEIEGNYVLDHRFGIDSRKMVTKLKTSFTQYAAPVKNALFISTIFLTLNTLGNGHKIISKHPYSLYYGAKIKNWFYMRQLNTFGYSGSMRECALAIRTWTYKQCLAQIVKSHLAHKLYRGYFDPSYDYTTDPEFLEVFNRIIQKTHEIRLQQGSEALWDMVDKHKILEKRDERIGLNTLIDASQALVAKRIEQYELDEESKIAFHNSLDKVYDSVFNEDESLDSDHIRNMLDYIAKVTDESFTDQIQKDITYIKNLSEEDIEKFMSSPLETSLQNCEENPFLPCKKEKDLIDLINKSSAFTMK